MMRALLVLLVVACGPCGPAWAGVPARRPADPTPEGRAAAVLEAWRDGRAGRLAALARSRAVDPFLVADALLGMRADGPGAPPPAADPLDAARDFARRAEAIPAAAGLAALVEEWRGLAAADLTRERRLRLARRRLEEQPDPRVLDETREDRDAAPWSVTAVLLRGGTDPGAAARAARRLGWRLGEARCEFEAALILLRERRLDAARRGFERASRAFRELESDFGLARSLQNLAEVLRLQGDLDGAERRLREALRLWQETGNISERVTILVQLGIVRGQRGDYLEAGRTLRRARAEAATLGNRTLHAKAASNLGNVECLRGRPEAGIAFFEEALGIQRSLGDAPGTAISLHGLGAAHGSLGRYDAALRYHEEARRAFTEAGNRQGAMQALQNVGAHHLARGDYAGARRALETVLEHAAGTADASLEITARDNLARLDRQLGRPGVALRHLERAIALAEQAGRRHQAAAARNALAAVCIDLGLFARAEALLRSVIRDAEALGAGRTADEARLGLGCLYLEAHRWAEARAVFEAESKERAAAWHLNLGLALLGLGEHERALACHRRAREVALAAGDRVEAVRALGNLGTLHLKDRRDEEAARALGEAIGEADAIGFHQATAFLTGRLAQAELRLGRPRDALASARRAVQLRAERRRGLVEEETFAFSEGVRLASDLGLEALHALGAEAGPGLGEQALWFVESGRSLSFLEALGDGRRLLAGGIPAGLAEAHASARERLRLREARYHARRAGAPVDPTAVEAARRSLDEANQELAQVVGRIHREAPRVAGTLAGEAIAPGALRAWLPPRSTLLLYQLTEERAFVLAVDARELRLCDLGPSGALAATAEAWLRELGDAGADEPGLAAKLHDALLGPVAPLLEGRDRVLVSPDGILSFVPFQALLREGPAGAERAVERWEVVYVPSATAAAALARETAGRDPGSGVLALGAALMAEEPEGGAAELRDLELRGQGRLPPLPESGAEARAVASLHPEARRTLLLGQEATRERLVECLGRIDGRLEAVHLACHGLVDTERPRLTGLVLSGGALLTLDDLQGLRIPADLAVLSACRTGRGRLVRGEGVVGLVQGFFQAGCPRVVVSNWKVQDDRARELMVAFHEKRTRGGRAPAAALRAVQREALRGGQHPAHWAAFVLWGLGD